MPQVAPSHGLSRHPVPDPSHSPFTHIYHPQVLSQCPLTLPQIPSTPPRVSFIPSIPSSPIPALHWNLFPFTPSSPHPCIRGPPPPSIIPPRSSVKVPGLHLQLSSLFRVPITPFRHRVLQPAARELNQSHRANICTHVSPDDRQDGPSALGPHTPVLRKQREPGLHSTRAGEEDWGGPSLLDNWPDLAPWAFVQGWDSLVREQKKDEMEKDVEIGRERQQESSYQRQGQRRKTGKRQAQRLNRDRHPRD